MSYSVIELLSYYVHKLMSYLCYFLLFRSPEGAT